jgi:ferrous iron transport protein A
LRKAVISAASTASRVAEVSGTLAELRPGERARVVSVGGDAEATRRLLDLGVIRGTSLEVVRTAPLGDPIEVRLRGYMLTLRRSQAEDILVERWT